MNEIFIRSLRNYHHLNHQQQENVIQLVDISKKFFQKKNLEPYEGSSIESEHTLIVECGHQPNFLPHSATWKKAFFMSWLCKKLEKGGSTPLAFFGLADQNISTARLLSKNQVPDLNKDGFIKIGFKISSKDRLRSFACIEKPPAEEWEKEIDRIRRHYKDISEKTRFGDENVKNQWTRILDILWSAYNCADNFPELNSLVFVRICREILGVNLFFFLYSDMHNAGMFLEESKKILKNLPRFNHIYNQEIARDGLNIPSVLPNHMPFWYECECGAKLDLFLDSDASCKPVCPGCKKEYHLALKPDFENLEKYYWKMDFNAVSRNIIMAQGLGDTIFVSGSGGSSIYGCISDRISKDLEFHRPITLAWQSKDRYLGMAHKIILRDLMKTFSLISEDFSSGFLKEKIEKKFNELSANLKDSKERDLREDLEYWSGLQNSAKNLLVFSRNLFATTPSFIDLLANYRSDTTIKIWENALDTQEVHEYGYMYQIRSDINYPGIFFPEIDPASFPELYTAIDNVGVN